MILLDPELEPDPAPARSLQAELAQISAKRGQVRWAERIPSVATLKRFLTQAQESVRLKGHVAVLLTTDAAIRKLNRRFRGKNKATDVLSFPADTLAQKQEKGDLAISVGMARKQAREHGHSLGSELKILMLHGLLHLAGYDHETDDGEMARRELKLRAELGLPQGLIERAGTPTLPPESRRKDGARGIPQGLKPKRSSVMASARLKSCPDTKPLRVLDCAELPSGAKARTHSAAHAARLKSGPFKASSAANLRSARNSQASETPAKAVKP
jgi:probable rRNA maturation factor